MSNQWYGLVDDLPAAKGNFITGCSKKLVFGPERSWPEYAMRCFILEPGSHSKVHTHAWPHYLFVHKGTGEMRIDTDTFLIQESMWIYVPGDLEHGFRNTSQTDKLYMLCIVPPEGDVNPLLINK